MSHYWKLKAAEPVAKKKAVTTVIMWLTHTEQIQVKMMSDKKPALNPNTSNNVWMDACIRYVCHTAKSILVSEGGYWFHLRILTALSVCDGTQAVVI